MSNYEYAESITGPLPGASPEAASRRFEMPPLTPGEQQLLDALTLPPEVNERLHTKFNTAIQAELDSCIDQGDKDIIGFVASVMEWGQFAAPGDPLPNNTGLYITGHIAPLDPAIRKYVLSVENHLVLGVLRDVDTETREEYRKREEQINEALIILCKESSMYKFLHTIASDTPKTIDLPLTLAERVIRETQIEYSVKREHGLQPNDSMSLHPGAKRTLASRLYNIDDETSRRTQLNTTDGKQRIMRLAVEKTNAVRTHVNGPDTSITTLSVNEYEEIIGVTENGVTVEILDELFIASNNLAQDMGNIHYLDMYIESDSILYDLVFAILKNDNPLKSVLDLLHEVAEETDSSILAGYPNSRNRVLVYLRQVSANIVATCGERVYWKKLNCSAVPQVVSQETIKRQTRIVIGEVEGDREQVAQHVIASGNTKLMYPTMCDTYDLKVRFNGYADEFIYEYGGELTKKAPFIPGYELAAAKKIGDYEDFYFKRLDIDPYYGSENEMLAHENIEAVVEQCEKIGLSQLSHDIAAVTSLSLTDLVRLVRSNSSYTFDPKYGVKKELNESFTDEYFSRLVDKDGYLHVQCTGAAAFLSHILKTAFPGCITGAIAGKVIQPNGIITMIGHQQTFVTIAERQYIVDSTPSSHNSGISEALTYEPYAQQSVSSQNRRYTEPSVEANVSGSLDEDIQVISTTQYETERILTEKAESALKRSTMILKAHFDLPMYCVDDKLYEQIIKLKKDADPLRRATSLLLRHDRGEVSEGELDTEIVYFDNLLKADPTLYKRLGIPHYDQVLLKTINEIIVDVRNKPV